MVNARPSSQRLSALERSRPREVRLTAEGIFVRGLSKALLIGALATLVIMTNASKQQAEERRLLQEHGGSADGLVIDLSKASGDSKTRWVAYRFSPDGEAVSYEGRSKIPLRVWQKLRIGSHLPIRFATNDPANNVPLGFEPNPLPMWMGPLSSAGLALVAVLVGVPVLIQRNLLADGRSTTGRVIAHHKADKGMKRVEYEYRILSGAMRRGKSSPMRKALPIGSTVTVIYDSENPERQALYPLPFVRLAK